MNKRKNLYKEIPKIIDQIMESNHDDIYIRPITKYGDRRDNTFKYSLAYTLPIPWSLTRILISATPIEQVYTGNGSALST